MLNKIFNRIKSPLYRLTIVGAALAITSCSSGGSCSGCGESTASPAFTITAPSEYPAGVATTVYLTIYNTSSVNATNLHYNILANTPDTNVINVQPDGANNNCDIIVESHSSCVFTATIESGSQPGSFTIGVTGTSGSTSLAQGTQTNAGVSDFTAGVQVNIGLVNIPTNTNPLYLLPSTQTVNMSNQSISVLFSVLVESTTTESINLQNPDGTPLNHAPILLGPLPVGGVYESNTVVSFSITYLPNQQFGTESLVAYGVGCSGNNCVSNIGYVSFVESGAGILTLAPSNVILATNSPSQTYTVANNGQSNINVTLPLVNSPFNLVNNCGGNPFTLVPVSQGGTSCTYTISYTGSTYIAESFPISYTNGIGGTGSTVFNIAYIPAPPLVTWVNGANTLNSMPNYGTMGTSAPGNVPGARYIPVSWTDQSSNFWMFGGQGYDVNESYGYLNDLWKYNPISGQWTWVSGSDLVDQLGVYGTLGQESSTNMPGARSAASSWTDQSGNFWLFGGYGYTIVTGNKRNALNDLWRYNTTTQQWTWMSGSESFAQPSVYGTLGVESTTNMPGARLYATSWTDLSGNLWLFGGSIPGSNKLFNDLWKYNINSGQWTWMSGSDEPNQNGTYGTLGVGSAGNVPGSRFSSATWIDNSGNLWLFGGSGNGDALCVYNDALNDLWKYNIDTGYWTWIGGSKCVNQLSVYGIRAVPESSNYPGARYATANWVDSLGNFWFFGGDSSLSNNSVSLNDLWQYNPTTGIWTWVDGSTSINQAGTYGTLGVGNQNNIPGARYSTASWYQAGNLWLFGGLGFAAQSVESGYMNDLWQINISNY